MRKSLPAASNRPRFAGQLLPHQREAVDYHLDNPRSLNADDVGLGKAIEAIAVMAEVLARDPAARVLAVTDAAVVSQFAGELARFLPGVPVARIDNVKGMGGDPRVVLSTYGLVNSRPETHQRLEPALIVLDEVSRVRGRGAQFDALLELTSGFDGPVLGMTATPMETTPEETYAILQVIGTPGLMTPSEFEALLVFDPPYEASPGNWVDRRFREFAPGGLETFAEYLHRYTLRRTAEDVGLSLPERVGDRVVWVPLTGQQAALHARAGAYTALAKFLRQTQAARGTTANGTPALVTAAIDRLIADGPTVEKTIGYAQNHFVLDSFGHELDELAIGWVRIDGNVKQAERERRIDAFENDPDIRVLLGTDSLERGLNLQQCRRMYSLDPKWNPAAENQREGRIRRIGSPHRTYEHVTFLADTPEARSKWATLDKRRSLAEALLRANTAPVRDIAQ